MKKILIIILAILTLTSCSIFRKTNKIKIDKTKITESVIETQIEEVIIVTNDTAVVTEIEVIEVEKPFQSNDIIVVSGDKVEAEAIIYNGTIKLTATAKPQQVKITQTTQTTKKTKIKEKINQQEKVNQVVKEKEVEKKGISFWLSLIVVLFLIYYFVIRKI